MNPLSPPAEQSPLDEGWSRTRWFVLLMLAVAAHFAFVFLFGAKKATAPRAVTNVPQLHIAESDNEFIALNDPTLFAQPHGALDFEPVAWRLPPGISPPTFHWTEPAPFLPVAEKVLGADFNGFLQTNRFAKLTLDFKPQPQFAEPTIILASSLPQTSTAQLVGGLAGRQWLNLPAIPIIAYNDILPPSRVQLLVDTSGNVISTVLLDSSEWDTADQQALQLARTAKFNPAPAPALGEMIFNWHTLPNTSTNTP